MDDTAHDRASDDGMPHAPDTPAAEPVAPPPADTPKRKPGRPRKSAVATSAVADDATPAADQSDDEAAAATVQTYEVHLPGLKPVRVKATGRADAYAKYKAAEGIIDSDHKPNIHLVKDGTG